MLRSVKCSLAAIVMVAGGPASASPAQQSGARAASAAELPASDAVARFHADPRTASVWFRSGPNSTAATQLIAILRRAEIDGLPNAPRLAARVKQAVRSAQSGRPQAVREAERVLSAAWVAYVRAIRSSPGAIIYGDGQVMPRTAVDSILYDAVNAPSLEQHLVSTSDVNPIYSQLREAALRQSRRTGGKLDKRLLANLDRARALPAASRYVVVDVASARLFMYEDGRVQDSMKVIVGQLGHRTPLIASMIHYTTLNPYWTPPDDWVSEKIAPAVVREGTSYLRERDYEVVAGASANAPVMAPEQVDWAAVAAGRERVNLRKKPSPANPMGEIKIPFANDRGIYLHDTPDKALFDQAKRTLSLGCIRLEDAPRLARWLHGRKPAAPSSEPEQHVQVADPVRIYVTYLTARVAGDEVTFRDDVYGLDREWQAEVASIRGVRTTGN
ncbi:MAG TPA: L,D-transpeptidase family protein [Sphingomicrobium sp.]|nr:L,D-transpeptidase family protein [Sphingomicrobium sp.]